MKRELMIEIEKKMVQVEYFGRIKRPTQSFKFNHIGRNNQRKASKR